MTAQRPAPRAAGRPLVLGHRGASAEAPENTLAAFRLAMEQGADGVELDVWRCRTGEVVVFHDEDARRIAGAPLAVARAGLGELRALDVGSHKGERFRGERIPLLGEVLEALPGAIVNVELKAGRSVDPRLALGVARLLREHRAEDRVLVSSFDRWLLAAFRAAAPGVATGLLFEETLAWRARLAVAAALLGPRAVHPPRALATPEAVRRWGRAGLAVNVWTVDAPEEVERLARLGVAGVISNVPGIAREAVRRTTGI
jgi:glycerophosphoryl diester phosphodiesterase